jgi:hypothetical protein
MQGGGTMNGAYAFTNHLAAIATGYSKFSTSGRFLSKDNKQVELGIGCFTALNQKYRLAESVVNKGDGKFLEVFAGVGKGYQYTTIESDPIFADYSYGSVSGSFQHIFLQFTYSIQKGSISSAYTIKGQYRDFGDYLVKGYNPNRGGAYRYFERFPSAWIVQPMATYKVGVNHPVCFTAQFGFNLIVSEPEGYYFSPQNFTCALGFEWRFNLPKN